MSADMMMRCEDVAPYLSAFADGELPEPLRSEVAEHVASCAACSATLARYADIDALFAALPRSAPAPELFDQILDTIASEEEEAAHRRDLRAQWGFSAIKRRITELDMPHLGASHPSTNGGSPRVRWASVAIPVLAALLLISVTLATFHWLPGTSTGLESQVPTPTPAPGEITLQKTKAAVQLIENEFAFAPVYPTYLPDGATLASVSISPSDADSEIEARVLNITWNVAGPIHSIHLSETATDNGLPGYSSLASGTPLRWQIGHAPWVQVAYNTKPKTLAIEQRRAGVNIGLDMPVQSNNAQGQTILRLMSLSMDSQYMPMPTAKGQGSTQIVPLNTNDTQNMVVHYTAVTLSNAGATQWHEETYLAPCAVSQLCKTRTSIAWGNGKPLTTDIISGQKLLHLDETQNTYSVLPASSASQLGANTNSALPKSLTTPFYLGNTYLTSGILWYIGESTYKDTGKKVYRLLWTSAPTRTYVYVSADTHQVIAVEADKDANLASGGGGPLAGTGAQSCLRYTSLEYLEADKTTDALFSLTPPKGYQQTQEQPLNITCG